MRRRAPVLIYDAECGFCRGWIDRWRRATGDHVRYVPYQRPDVPWRYGVSRRAAAREAKLVEPLGRQYGGAAAVFHALLRARSPWVRLLARVGLAPGARAIATAVYRLIAAHRGAASRAQRRLQRILGPPVSPHPLWRALSAPALARRALGVVYFFAFSSLRSQVLGLYGQRGIVPVRGQLARVEQAGRALAAERRPRLWRWRVVPSLLWLDSSDAGLKRLPAVGQLAGVALALGVLPRLAAAVAWGAYLSFVSVGRPFLPFQWDALLLEAGAVAIFGRPRRGVTRALARRLQLESGLAKLDSRDPTWRDLSACCYHQETQPLPTPVGWYAHHLPRWTQRFATALTLFVECAVPPLAFGPRRLRELAFTVLSGFQVLIALTGNYGFFNWLTIVLNLTLVEQPAPKAPRTSTAARAADALVTAVDDLAAAVILLLGAAELVGRRWPATPGLGAVRRIAAPLEALHVTGSYGLFSVMTTIRPEIVIEGSNDGAAWKEYGFRYKPGDVSRAPRWAAPHQPRLDWQMWFAALGEPPAWFTSLLGRLLEGSPDVLALLRTNPFPDAPPRYVRAILYEYRMTSLRARRETGAWWARTEVRVYFPTCSLTPLSRDDPSPASRP
jgi:predicted DCC family thiol-disulfide oxidoreductase YuxK